MTPRQTALLEYHRDIAAFGTNSTAPVFLIFDLEDSIRFEIASVSQPNCAQKRDAIKATGAYPVLTLALSLEAANALLDRGWPAARKIAVIPDGRVPVLLISGGRCLVSLVLRE